MTKYECDKNCSVEKNTRAFTIKIIKMTENLAANLNCTRLCRCCALEHNLMYDMFCGTCSNAQTYHEVVMECAPVQLSRDDGLPSLVCHKCVLILESFIMFRRKCVESESMLKRMNSNISRHKQETFDLNRIKRDIPMLDNIKEEPNDTGVTAVPENEFDGFEKNSSSEEHPELKLYDEIKFENTTVNENKPGTNSDIDRSNSEIDRQLSENSVYVKEEFVGDESEKFNFDTDRTEPTLPFACDRCDKSFKRKSSLIKHRRTHTGEKPYSCDKCEKSFSCKWNLSQHQKIHTGEKPYSCDKCGKSFNCKSNINEHQKIHTGEKPFSCDECGKLFHFKSNLNQHRKIHTGEKPFSCDMCDRSFNSKSYLNEHQIIHTGEKPYSCGACKKTFARRLYLKRHRIVHTAEKPYVCDVCFKSLMTKQTLVEHRRLHTGEKPFGCDSCDQTFNKKRKLRQHVEKDHRPVVNV